MHVSAALALVCLTSPALGFARGAEPLAAGLARVASSVRHAEYAFARLDGEAAVWSAPNRSHELRSRLSTDGLEVFPRETSADGVGAEWTLRLRTTRFGRAGSLHELSDATLAVHEARAELDHGLLLEWFTNDERGIEHGYTIAERLHGAEPLWIGLDFGGDLSLRIDDGQRSGVLVDARNAIRMRYRDLVVFDATGRELDARLAASPHGVGIEIDDADAAYPVTVDPLLTGPAWTADGDQIDAEFGASVDSAGDVNGDGYSDVIVGAPEYDGGQSNEGRAFLFLGSSGGLAAIAAWSAEGDQVGADFARCVATAGDVNGDGFSDVIVGAPEYDAGETNDGRAFLFLGSSSGLATSAAWTAEGGQFGARFARCVATAGDVDGDGYSDVIVGAPGFANGEAGEGRAFVYRGSAGGLSASPQWTAESDVAGGEFGSAVASAGDVNADGFDDVVVGADSVSNGEFREGRAYVYMGSATGPSAAAAWTVESDQPDARLGTCVGTAGDVDGDGFADVFVTAPWFGTGGSGVSQQGRVQVFLGTHLGLEATASWTEQNPQSGAQFGGSASTAGDVNGDGFSDFVVGARTYDGGETDEGRAVLYLGSAFGLEDDPAWIGEGDQAGARYGASVSTAGDVNGDGYGDLLVGAVWHDSGAHREGRAYVYLGGSRALSPAHRWAADDAPFNAGFGASVASAGDVDGDGYGDVIIGSPAADVGFVNSGRAYVYHGSETGLAPLCAWVVSYDQFNANLGRSVASAGDVNGDGFGDVIVGAPGAHASEFELTRGLARVYHGSALGLAVQPAWSVFGTELSGGYGTSVASAGDVNGDGYGDVIVGAFWEDDGVQFHEGRAYIYFGSASGLSTEPAWSAEGDQDDARFGVAVACAGDVNGDGYSDVIVGATRFDGGQTDEGRVYVYLGSPTGPSRSEDWLAESDQASSEFGVSVASAGDVNGDGYSDVIVGAMRFDGGHTDEGRAIVYLGSLSGLGASAAWTAEGEQAGARLGECVRSAGDVNGDGYSDVVVGAGDFDTAALDDGAAYVYLGSASGLAASAVWSANGAAGAQSAHFGAEVASAGDVDGDGYGDVIAGAFGFETFPGTGRAFVYLGNEGNGSWTRALEQRRARDGAPIAPLGAFDARNSFRAKLEFARSVAGFTWGTGRHPRAFLQWQVAPLGTQLSSVPVQMGEGQALAAPVRVFSELVDAPRSFVNSSGVLVRPIDLERGPLHWRARLRTNNPLFPVSPWVSIAGSNVTETKLRATGLAIGGPLVPR